MWQHFRVVVNGGEMGPLKEAGHWDVSVVIMHSRHRPDFSDFSLFFTSWPP